jgi:hypothetical protein
MAAQTNVPTDYNPGSQVRTLNEALGSVVEMQATADLATAFQALAYGAMSLFGVGASVAQSATGVATFATSFPVSAALPTTQAVLIPSGTLMQTAGGTQFATIAAATLASGTASITAGIIASLAGAAGNVPASGITGTPLTSIGYPLFVSNGVATAGGADAGTQSSALALFTSRQASLGLSSPVAVANAAIGVTVSGTGETVRYAGNVEPWLLAGSGAGSGTAGFTLYIDNGTGGASSALIAATAAWLSGNITANQSGFRPNGVPYQVLAVTPVFANVTVSGTLTPGLFASGGVAAGAASGVTAYFNTLGVSAPVPGGTGLNAAGQPQIAARVADAGIGAFSSLSVVLAYASASGTAVPLVSGATGTRVILASLSVQIG